MFLLQNSYRGNRRPSRFPRPPKAGSNVGIFRYFYRWLAPQMSSIPQSSQERVEPLGQITLIIWVMSTITTPIIWAPSLSKQLKCFSSSQFLRAQGQVTSQGREVLKLFSLVIVLLQASTRFPLSQGLHLTLLWQWSFIAGASVFPPPNNNAWNIFGC